MSRMLVVVGMHRSGSSFLAHVLHDAGMYLGNNLINEAESGNLEGHWEAREAVLINEHILQISGGAWDRSPAGIRTDVETDDRMDRFLRELAVAPVAGWKDPRTSLTFPAWKPHLADYRLVICLRNPVSVARSLQVREGWSLEQGLELWASYNERLMEYLPSEERVLWFDYDTPDGELAEALRSLCEQVGLHFDAAAARVFNPHFRHHKSVDLPPEGRIRSLYEALRVRAGRARRSSPPSVTLAPVGRADGVPDAAAPPQPIPDISAVPPGDVARAPQVVSPQVEARTDSTGSESSDGRVNALGAMETTCVDLSSRVESIDRALRQQNEVQQGQSRQVRGLVDAIVRAGSVLQGLSAALPHSELEARLVALASDLNNLQTANRECVRQIGLNQATMVEVQQALEIHSDCLRQHLLQIEHAAAQAEGLARRQDQAVDAVGQVRTAVAELEARLRDAASETGSSVAALEAGLRDACGRTESAVTGLESRLRGTATETAAKIADLEHHLRGFAAETAAKVAYLESRTREMAFQNESRMAALEVQVAGVDALRNEVQGRLEQVARGLEQTQTTAFSEISLLRAGAIAKASGQEALRRELATLSADLAAVRSASQERGAHWGQLHRQVLQLTDEVASLRQREQQLVAMLADCHVFIGRVRGSHPFRVRRALARRAGKLAAGLRRLVRGSKAASRAA